MSLDALYARLAARRVFVAYRLEPKADGKTNKIPIDPRSGLNSDAQNPSTWLTPAEAVATGLPIGIVITQDCGLFCVDIDNCRTETGWSQLAIETCARFPGACIEVSASGRGLHIFGSYMGTIPAHRTRRNGKGLEIYTRARFIALTGSGMTGDILSDHTQALHQLIVDEFPEEIAEARTEWHTEPYRGWRGGGTDDQIIGALKARMNAHATFGGGLTFTQLWEGDADALAAAYPSGEPGKAYDGSAADQALANHLAFATGYNHEHVLRLMWLSGLVREKWDRDDYLPRTIIRACDRRPVDAPGTPEQTAATPPPADNQTPALIPEAGGAVVPAGTAVGGIRERNQEKTFCTTQDQISLFGDAIYVRDIHQALLPDGTIIAGKQFDVTFGGYDFQMRIEMNKPTTSAWEAFTESQVVRFRQVQGLLFDPRMPPLMEVMRDGQVYVNSWQPLDTPATPGDASLFLDHLKKLYPNGDDALILLSYFAAIVQHKGVKFQWWPLLQGCEGNGKTFFSLALQYCVGKRYTNSPKAAELASRFNASFYGKILVTVEDVKISEDRGSMWETLKPMITNNQLEIESKGVDKVVREVCFNGIMNSNHKDAIRKTANDRRIAPFFGAQQHAGDLMHCGMGREYFTALYGWAENGGWAIINHYLQNFAIPDKYNPATHCLRAPDTSSTGAALAMGLGAIEQEVVEAIDEGRAGFRGGWVSSMAFDDLLATMGKAKQMPRYKRHELLDNLGYMLHPGLKDGRPVDALPDGSRPRLYMPKAGMEIDRAGTPAEIAKRYVEAQKPR